MYGTDTPIYRRIETPSKREGTSYGTFSLQTYHSHFMGCGRSCLTRLTLTRRLHLFPGVPRSTPEYHWD